MLCRWRKERELPEEGENLGMGPLKYDKKLNNLAHASYTHGSVSYNVNIKVELKAIEWEVMNL